jgi:hypothetical protein
MGGGPRRPGRRLLAILLLLLATPSPAQAQTESPVPDLAAELKRSFDARLQDLAAYKRQVETECREFPEGDLFPYLFPANAYASLGLAGSLVRSDASEKVGRLLAPAIASVARRTKAPKGNLMGLASYGDHATYICQLNVSLGAYRLLGGTKHAELHDHLSRLIREALAARGGKPLRSFPAYTWPFDTIPCLTSLALHDAATGAKDSSPPIEAHLAWVDEHATDAATGLPWSRIDNETGERRELPRGCDLSLRIMFLGWFSPDRAKATYQAYAKHFWLERFVAAGFAEWPEGKEHFADLDSGPILMGIGSAASALGMGAARAAGDQTRLARLTAQVKAMREGIAAVAATGTAEEPALLAGLLPVRPGYISGSLFGDAVLFLALTWERWD